MRFACLVIVLMLVACSGDADIDLRSDTLMDVNSAQPSSGDAPIDVSADTVATSGMVPEESTDNGMMTRASLGDKWPLTVESGRVECIKGSAVVFHVDGGATYAVNGAAKSITDYPDIDPIWRDDSSMPGTKISIRPIIEAGRALCP